jgi:hypothetical protein
MEGASLDGPRSEKLEKLHAAFASSSIIETFVPTCPEIDLSDQFERWDGSFHAESTSIVPFIEQRPFLLLGKNAQIKQTSEAASHMQCR